MTRCYVFSLLVLAYFMEPPLAAPVHSGVVKTGGVPSLQCSWELEAADVLLNTSFLCSRQEYIIYIYIYYIKVCVFNCRIYVYLFPCVYIYKHIFMCLCVCGLKHLCALTYPCLQLSDLAGPGLAWCECRHRGKSHWMFVWFQTWGKRMKNVEFIQFTHQKRAYDLIWPMKLVVSIPIYIYIHTYIRTYVCTYALYNIT